MPSEPSTSRPGHLVFRVSALPSYAAHCALRTAAHGFPWIFRQHGYQMRPPLTNVGALIGTGVHGAAELGLVERMDGLPLTPLPVLEDAAVQTFRDRRAAEEHENAVVSWDNEAPDANAAEYQIRRLTARVRSDIIETAEPIAVEARIESTIRPGIILSGQADLLHLERYDAANPGADVARQLNRLRDLKTTKHDFPAYLHGPQLGGYSLSYRGLGYTVDDAAIDMLRRVPILAAQPPVKQHHLDIRSCEDRAWSVIDDYTAKVERFLTEGNPDVFVANPATFLCNMRHCRLFGMPACPVFRKGR